MGDNPCGNSNNGEINRFRDSRNLFITWNAENVSSPGVDGIY
jgi:hypothetical protein